MFLFLYKGKLHLLKDKYSLSALAARKRSGLPFSGSLGMKKETPQIYKVESAVASEETDDALDPDIFTKVLTLSSGNSY
jgi:hypothetical protein